MSKFMDTDMFVEKAKLVHGDVYDYSKVVYQNSHEKVCIVCPEHGEFWQTPNNHLRGRKCPKCRNLYRRCTEDFVKDAREIHGYKYDYSKTVYVRNNEKVCIICPIHGEFWQTPQKHLSGRGCPNMECINARREATSMSHYGVRNPAQSLEVQQKMCATNIAKYRVKNPMQNEDVKKRLESKIESEYGVKCVLQLPEMIEKSHETKLRNGSYGKSESEDELYEMLCVKFGEHDVLRQYKSEKYPFACDFYIVSRDMYIELNGTWSHGHHWFNSDSDLDLMTVDLYHNKFTCYYDNVISVWTDKDVCKRNIARQNDLNYVVFWYSDFRDINPWFELGCPDGKDWDHEYSWLSK